jgi:hypothetical protein
LFGAEKPRAKVPLSSKRIKEIKRAIKRKQAPAALQMLRDLREDLEKIEKKIKTKKS